MDPNDSTANITLRDDGVDNPLELNQQSTNNSYPNGVTINVEFEANCDATITAEIQNQVRPTGVTSPWGWSFENLQNNQYDYANDNSGLKTASLTVKYYFVLSEYTYAHKGTYTADLVLTLAAD